VGAWVTVGKKQSYADKVKAGPKQPLGKKALKSIAKDLLKPPKVPMEFGKMQVTINGSRKFKSMKPQMARKVISEMLGNLGIKKDIVRYSMIGKSIIELYYPLRDGVFEKIKGKIEEQGGSLVLNFSVMEKPSFSKLSDDKFMDQVAGRLARIIGPDYTPLNLRKTILEGCSTELTLLVEAKMAKFGFQNRSPKAAEDYNIVEEVSGMDTDSSQCL
jgi:hypothetical protein